MEAEADTQQVQQDVPKDDNNNTQAPAEDTTNTQAPAENTTNTSAPTETSSEQTLETSDDVNEKKPEEEQSTDAKNPDTAEKNENNDEQKINDAPTNDSTSENQNGKSEANEEEKPSDDVQQENTTTNNDATAENDADDNKPAEENQEVMNKSQNSLQDQKSENTDPANAVDMPKTTENNEESVHKASSDQNENDNSQQSIQGVSVSTDPPVDDGSAAEREELKKQISELIEEVNKYKTQAHEFTVRCEHLEKKLEEAKEEAKQEKPVSRKKSRAGPKRKPVRRRLRRIMRSEHVTYLTEEEESTIFDSTELLYAKVASMFPEISISQVLLAEKKFIEVDKNDDGTIYASELEMVLVSSGLSFTKQQVQDTLRKVDVDGTGSLDFFECLTVIDFIRAHRASSPEVKTKSSLCAIM